MKKILKKLADLIFKRTGLRVMKKGYAESVLFIQEDEYINGAMVTVYEGGLVHIISEVEEISTFIGNLEILWKTMYSEPEEAYEEPPTNVIPMYRRRHSQPGTMPPKEGA